MKLLKLVKKEAIVMKTFMRLITACMILFSPVVNSYDLDDHFFEDVKNNFRKEYRDINDTKFAPYVDWIKNNCHNRERKNYYGQGEDGFVACILHGPHQKVSGYLYVNLILRVVREVELDRIETREELDKLKDNWRSQKVAAKKNKGQVDTMM